MKIEEQKQWLAQWQTAEAALRQQKMHELANLSDREAQQATQSVLALAGQVRPGHRRWTTSGLVEQQRWFYLHHVLQPSCYTSAARELANIYPCRDTVRT